MIRVLIYTDQPVLASGFVKALAGAGLELSTAGDVTEHSADALADAPPDVVLLDLTGEFTFETLAGLHTRIPGSNLVIRVGPMSRELIFQALECGVRGILPVGLSPEALVQSLKRIAAGEVLIEVTDPGFDTPGEKRVNFSEREKQVLELLAQGLKNKEIAGAMNLAEGTVKVYLSRLFKKTKVRDRFELMLYRAQDRKLLSTDAAGRVVANAMAPKIAEFVPAMQVPAQTVLAS